VLTSQHLTIGIPVKTANHLAQLAVSSALDAQHECRRLGISCEVVLITADKAICGLTNPSVRCIYYAPTGIYPAFNHIVTHSTGEYILILGSDDLIANPACLAESIREAFCPSSPFYKAGVIVSPIYIGDHPERRQLREARTSLIRNLRIQSINHPGMIVSSSTYAKIGGYSCCIGAEADYEFCLRLIREKISLLKSYKPFVFHRLGGVSTAPSKNRLRAHLRCIRSVYYVFPSLILLAVPLRIFSYLCGSTRIFFSQYLP
jgi:glycosyltransferase involved in cell wall biosynthesis